MKMATDVMTNPAPDHRNEGFSAKSAMYEETKTRAAMIDRHIMTKPGLPAYTDRELEKKSGEVISFNTRKPLRYTEFQSYPEAKQISYLQAMDRDWPGISARAIGIMMGAPYKTIADIMKKAGLQRGKGINPAFKREQFLREMCSPDSEPAATNALPFPAFNLKNMSLERDAGDVKNIIERFGISGRIRIEIEALN